MAKLSVAQSYVLKKLMIEAWQSPYTLKVGRSTLDALVKKGFAEKKYGSGHLFSPRTDTYYRLAR